MANQFLIFLIINILAKKIYYHFVLFLTKTPISYLNCRNPAPDIFLDSRKMEYSIFFRYREGKFEIGKDALREVHPFII